MKRWVVGKPDRERAKALAEECDIDAFAALLAVVRGIDDPSELELMLSPEPILCDPNELADIKKAADFINSAIENGIKIAVFGDYDCDGVTATAILYDYLISRGVDAVYYIPDRISEGYGMNKSAVDKLAKQGVGLIITVDNGISCAEEIEYARTLSIDTVVTDHHIPPEQLPDAVAVVDPHRADCGSSFKEICGAMVAFKLICVLDDKEPEQMLSRYGDLLCIATVGDVMPLTDENRAVVRYGTELIKRHPRTGLGAILSVSGIERSTLDTSRVSFGIVPRINAAGRMGDAKRALTLLLETDMLSALKIAGEIDDDNAERQRIEREISAAAFEKIERCGYNHNRVIVVEGEGWHSGIVGIVASRIVEKYGKPAIVLSVEGEVAHGSGRSLSGMHMHKALTACGDTLLKFGGHELAAGVSVSTQNIELFRKTINEYAATLPPVFPTLNIDFRLNPSGMSVDMVEALRVLEPFGNGNAAPVFGLFGVKLDRITAVGGGKHLKLLFTKDGGAFQAMLFGVTSQDFCFETGEILDLAVSLDTNIFREEINLTVRIKAIRKSGVDEDALFRDIAALDTFLSGGEADFTLLLPDRAQVGAVYKRLCAGSFTEERSRYMFLDSIGLARSQIALKTLCELGLADKNMGIYTAVRSDKKTELTKSATYKKLCEGGKSV